MLLGNMKVCIYVNDLVTPNHLSCIIHTVIYILHLSNRTVTFYLHTDDDVGVLVYV